MKNLRQLSWVISLAVSLVAIRPDGFAADVPPVPASAFPVVITDGAGRVVKLSAAPQRIISLSPAATDILVKFGAQAELVGVTRYCTIPAVDESHVKRLGGMLDPDYESLVALKPDLVVVPLLADKSMQDKLTALALTFVVLHPEGMAGVLADIRLISRATGHDAQGETTVRNIEGLCGLVESRWKDVPLEKRPRVLIRMGGVSPAPGSYVGDLLAAAGGHNVLPPGAKAWVTISPESMLQLHPDLIVDIPDPDASSEPSKQLSAPFPVKIIADGQAFYRPGPDLGLSLWQLAHAIYPDRFPESAPPPATGPSAK